jgi:hypothetical protein
VKYLNSLHTIISNLFYYRLSYRISLICSFQNKLCFLFAYTTQCYKARHLIFLDLKEVPRFVSQFSLQISYGGSRNSLRNLSKLSLNCDPYSKTDTNQVLQCVHNRERQVHKWGIENWIKPSGRVRTLGKNRNEGTDPFVWSGLVQS